MLKTGVVILLRTEKYDGKKSFKKQDFMFGALCCNADHPAAFSVF